MKRVLFVCLGNICRSPTAHGVFRHLVEQQGLAHLIEIDSAGTAAYHVGNAPDHRSAAAALQRGYDLSDLRARQAIPADFDHYDYILAMDGQNLEDLQGICPADYKGHLGLFLSFVDDSTRDVPDPYYGGASGFDQVLDLVERASDALLQQIRKELS
ncbi:low molecular weight protein-tyrosine-phosphatase [Amphritea balenae]|uniref:protein-tyrosine-phosphatase n=1 Tax=Amphritea balenae TaxID=452629 RepID=A0A3P1STY5_9GAMM|nr:low molecular weight protein-tyrosine-phosphatase [Amphritea balenae]RRD00674.1 low molecular weight phosphotyrosine protein phosphatase [Amphritea balenae]GGK68834.1 phosphotyrosine protein phosphatase [Amphritea balenae]